MHGDVQLEQDSWYFANEMPVSDWMWRPEEDQLTSDENLTKFQNISRIGGDE